MSRVAFKGQVYSAPMDWGSILDQLDALEKQEARVALPVSGAVLTARVRVSLTAGLVDLNSILREATVRRDVVVQYIRLMKQKNHPDYKRIDMAEVQKRAAEMPLTRNNIPSDVVDLMNELSESDKQDFMGVDKAATPAERAYAESDLARLMRRARPLTMTAQRDSDANKDVQESRTSALSQFANVNLQVGSALEQQFVPTYVPRVFSAALPWCVGGPDFKHQSSRRSVVDNPRLSSATFTSMLSSCCEYQIRADPELLPSV